MRLGVSTHLFHGQRLARRHFEQVREAGFDLIEIFATPTHFDYRSAEEVSRLAGWLGELGLTPWSLHLPICDAFTGGRWGRAYSNASSDARLREEAVREATAAVLAARDLGCGLAVLHLGLPRDQPVPAGDNDAGAVRRSLEATAAACHEAGVRLALEVIPNELATASALVEWFDGDLELPPDAGICLDVGHAHLTGGAPEAVELVAGHLLTTHVHDNRGRTDDHLVPFDGTIDWPTTLMALSKVGYQGPLVFEVADHGEAAKVLTRTVAAGRRIQAILEDLTQPFGFAED